MKVNPIGSRKGLPGVYTSLKLPAKYSAFSQNFALSGYRYSGSHKRWNLRPAEQVIGEVR